MCVCVHLCVRYVFLIGNSKKQASYAKKKKSFLQQFTILKWLVRTYMLLQDGELLKEAFLACAKSLFDGFPSKKDIMSAINDLQLLNNSVTRRIEAITGDMKTQLTNDITVCKFLRYMSLSVQSWQIKCNSKNHISLVQFFIWSIGLQC